MTARVRRLALCCALAATLSSCYAIPMAHRLVDGCGGGPYWARHSQKLLHLSYERPPESFHATVLDDGRVMLHTDIYYRYCEDLPAEDVRRITEGLAELHVEPLRPWRSKSHQCPPDRVAYISLRDHDDRAIVLSCGDYGSPEMERYLMDVNNILYRAYGRRVAQGLEAVFPDMAERLSEPSG